MIDKLTDLLLGIMLGIGLLFLLAGCTTVSVEMEHISHPLAGWPTGPTVEEDWVSTVGVVGRKEYGRWYVEQGLGYNVAGRDGGGFKGPGLTYTGRVGVQIWTKQN